MRHRLLIAIACVAFALAGCSKGGQQTAPPQGTAPPALTNTTGLPLPDNAIVLDVRDFHQVVDPAQEKSTSLATLGKGTYTGREVIASSLASADDLNNWLASVAPPQGYTKTKTSASVEATARRYGIGYVAFVSGNNKGATIVVMDPKTVTSKLGPVLTMLDKYSAMPAPLKAGMDSQVKQRTGTSITEMLDKSAPLGAALAAVSQFRGSDKRAIILITAQKQ